MYDFRKSMKSVKVFMEGPDFRYPFEALDGNFWERWVQRNYEQRPFVAQFFPDDDQKVFSNLKILVSRKQGTTMSSTII